VNVDSEPIALDTLVWGFIHMLDKFGELRLASSRNVAACVGMRVHPFVLAFAEIFLLHLTLMVLLGCWIVSTGGVVVLRHFALFFLQLIWVYLSSFWILWLPMNKKLLIIESGDEPPRTER
jgi:hypothetical protein